MLKWLFFLFRSFETESEESRYVGCFDCNFYIWKKHRMHKIQPFQRHFDVWRALIKAFFEKLLRCLGNDTTLVMNFTVSFVFLTLSSETKLVWVILFSLWPFLSKHCSKLTHQPALLFQRDPYLLPATNGTHLSAFIFLEMQKNAGAFMLSSLVFGSDRYTHILLSIYTWIYNK